MNNYENEAQKVQENHVERKLQAIEINPYYKEIYYQQSLEPMKDRISVFESRQKVWNHMTQLSMMNAVTQMCKKNRIA